MLNADLPLTDERRREIRRRLAAAGQVRAGELASLFGVSEDTIRRDLRDMAAAGECRRVYGGALPLSPASGPLSARLAEAAVSLVPARATVLIDAGSTNLALAARLPEHQGITVLTNAPTVAVAASARAGVEVIVLGGRIEPRGGAAVGAGTVAALGRFRPDLFVVGACGADSAHGLTAFSLEEAAFKRAAARQSREVMATVTTEKLGTAAPFLVLPAEGLSTLVLEADADGAHEAAFAALGVRVLRAARPQH